MSQTDSSFLSDDPDQSLTILEEFLTRFLEAWETDPPPDLREFLPKTGAIRRLTLVELIKVDLEYRWRVHNLPKRLDEYCREFPELLVGGIPADLVYEEFHIRKQAGDDVDAQDYLTAYPDQETEIACLLGLDQEYVSTALFKDEGKAELAEIEPGQQLDDFELLARLGEGAFAHVYLARQVSMQRMVAVKISADHGMEPQTLAQMDHNHIVRVYDQRPLADRGLRLLYMQYVAGGTLQPVVSELRECDDESPTGEILLRAVDRALDDRGETRPGESRLRRTLESAPWDETVCWIGSRLAGALDYAHGLGVLHRDIKPANVLLTAEGSPQLADFNISFSSKLDGVTPATYFGGSLAYMSPEQLEAYSPAYDRAPDSLDGRSDLYSLGVLLWELVTGRRPFHDTKSEGGPLRQLEEMIGRRRKVPDETTSTPWCAPRILEVLRKCLEPNREDRWQSGSEFAAQLELCRHPQAHDLLIPPKSSLRRRLFVWSPLIVLLLLLVPNVAAGRFNLLYNIKQIGDKLPLLSQKAVFEKCVLVINSILYPLGVAWALLRTFRIRRRIDDPAADPKKIRARALGLGHFAAIIGVSLWTLAGLAYPVAIHVASGSLPTIVYVQFFASLVLCGLIAAAYPFFFVSLYSLRVMYPALLHGAPDVTRDIGLLTRLKEFSSRYLLGGALAPSLGIAMVLLLGSRNTESQRDPLFVFTGVGIAGFFILWAVHRRLQKDIDLIVAAMEDVRQ